VDKQIQVHGDEDKEKGGEQENFGAIKRDRQNIKGEKIPGHGCRRWEKRRPEISNAIGGEKRRQSAIQGGKGRGLRKFESRENQLTSQNKQKRGGGKNRGKKHFTLIH